MTVEEEIAAVADRRVVEWQTLREGNRAETGRGELYDRWVLLCQENDAEVERIRKQHFPRAGHLIVSENEAMVASPKLRSMKHVWSR